MCVSGCKSETKWDKMYVSWAWYYGAKPIAVQLQHAHIYMIPLQSILHTTIAFRKCNEWLEICIWIDGCYIDFELSCGIGSWTGSVCSVLWHGELHICHVGLNQSVSVNCMRSTGRCTHIVGSVVSVRRKSGVHLKRYDKFIEQLSQWVWFPSEKWTNNVNIAFVRKNIHRTPTNIQSIQTFILANEWKIRQISKLNLIFYK